MVPRSSSTRTCGAKSTSTQFNAQLQEIRQYEQMLTDEGIVLLKFWIHLSQDGQKQRLRDARVAIRRRAGA